MILQIYAHGLPACPGQVKGVGIVEGGLIGPTIRASCETQMVVAGHFLHMN